MDFQTFHKYNRLVRRGLTKPLSCSHCQEPLSLEQDKDSEPVLICYYCQSLTRPGLAMYNDIKSVVQEHLYKAPRNKFYGPV